MKSIKTGADGLVELVNRVKKIKSKAAAKELGVSLDTLTEWAEFLEQEGRISMQYGFFGVTLHKVQGTKEEVVEAGKKFISEKDVFKRKIDSVISKLSQEEAGFKDIKEEYQKVHKQIKSEIDSVKKDIEELQKFEDLKQNLDKDIENQINTYKKTSDKIKKELEEDENKYNSLLSDIENYVSELDGYNKDLSNLESKKKNITAYVEEGRKKLLDVENELININKKISDVNKSIELKKNEFVKLNSDVQDDKKKSVVKLVNWIEQERVRIQKEQKVLLADAKEKTKIINESKSKGDAAFKTFSTYFDKKLKVEKDIENIEKEFDSLTTGLNNLKQRISTFKALSTNKEIKAFKDEIEKQIKKYEKERNSVAKQVDKLIDNIRG